MGFRLGIGAVVMVVALALPAAFAAAKPLEPRDDSDSLYSQFERLSQQALSAAAEAVETSKDAIAKAERDLAPQLRTFQQILNEQKAQFDKFGEDATAQFDAWKQEFTESWAAAWPDIRRSAAEALDRFREWLETQSTNEPIHI